MALDRGNDSEAARRDLSSQYAGFESAEDMIRHQESQFDVELNKALNKPVDPVATAALDLSGIDPANEGGVVRDAAVRGGRLVVVEEHEGALKKWSIPYGPQRGTAPATAKAQVANRGQEAPPAAPAADAEAPSDVKVDDIKAKLKSLNVSAGDARNKDDLWALLPQDARDALVADAATS